MYSKIKKSILVGAGSVVIAFCASSLAGPAHVTQANSVKSGNPSTDSSYIIKGKRYYPLAHVSKGYTETGVASWYNIPTNFGVQTASGQRLNDHAMTAASPILPMGTKVKVTNLNNNKSVVVTINDRGPYADHRIIDLTIAAAKKIGYVDQGTAHVKVVVVS